MTPLAALADRVERAEGPYFALDTEIAYAIDHPLEGLARPYTASLDAAMTLVGTDAFWRLGNDGEGPDVAAFKATVTFGEGPSLTFHDAVAATPALALVAAALRAREPRA
jgi:hypothetical protein